jgi:uncharacterized protein (TIGR02145 family)
MKPQEKLSACLLAMVIMIIIMVTGCKKTDEPETVTDIDGNIYKTIVIGTQTWLEENLKTTKYNDGTNIPNVTDNSEWMNLITAAYCWYDNNISNKKPYGALYNWHAVNTGKLCPSGWHVPSFDEFQNLRDFLGDTGPGGQLKEKGTGHWKTPNTGATNSSGFTALPGGKRDPFNNNNGAFIFFGEAGYFWSSSQGGNPMDGKDMALFYDNAEIGPGENVKGNGYSVRCIKNN